MRMNAPSSFDMTGQNHLIAALSYLINCTNGLTLHTAVLRHMSVVCCGKHYLGLKIVSPICGASTIIKDDIF